MREALADADDFATFAEFHGNEELIEATSKVATLLSKMRAISLKQTILAEKKIKCLQLDTRMLYKLVQ